MSKAGQVLPPEVEIVGCGGAVVVSAVSEAIAMAECVTVQCVPVGIACAAATTGYLCTAKIWAIGRNLGCWRFFRGYSRSPIGGGCGCGDRYRWLL
ncbi:MAG: hypothetical protein KME55_42080 [Nostoc indistinguendum CM1-VF10]|nr:hypothetical protein [Nostoc indistinguendum CM1-VF10]